MSKLSDLKFDNSWIQQLSPETKENLEKSKRLEGIDNDNNRQRRPVYNGHYVLVKPTGLKEPQLLLHSRDVAEQLLQIDVTTDEPDFVLYVSGNAHPTDSWATPYALSIMGTRYTNNCPYGTGNGYGDGRAISIGEVNGYELQLKGAGKTPFCRGADGRAVLRSSIREFLASEAMHFLGIGTTRALSLVLGTDTTQRPWYTPSAKLNLPDMDDPRLANYTEEQRKTILAQLRTEKVDPNVMITERCAITCRVASSFVRVGHVDLFARRLQQYQQQHSGGDDGKDSREYQELVDMVWHACYREFRTEAYDPFHSNNDLDGAARSLLQHSAEALSTMVAEWLRVGFAQGNFNGDNCLVGGKTMDYGPFGFMEEYAPEFAKWTGSGKHFQFMNQPQAALINYQVLVESVVMVMNGGGPDDDRTKLIDEFMDPAIELFQTKVKQVFRRKLGFDDENNEAADDLWQDDLLPLLRLNRVDWTLFWRQLSLVAEEYTDYSNDNYEAMMAVLEGEGPSSPFYEPLSSKARNAFLEWIPKWRAALKEENNDNDNDTATTNSSSNMSNMIATRMKLVNPKYVLREWMLVDAYTKAEQGQYDELERLHDLIQHPYDEGTAEEEERYYQRTPERAHLKGGTSFMS